MLKVADTVKITRSGNGAMRAVERCLQEIPFASLTDVRVGSSTSSDQADFLVNLALAGEKHTIIVDVESSGQPRSIRDAVNQLYRSREAFPDAYGVIVAPYISPRGAAICEREGVGYV